MDWLEDRRISVVFPHIRGRLLDIAAATTTLSEPYGDLSLPVTEQVANEVIFLPMYPELTCEQLEYVAKTVKEAL